MVGASRNRAKYGNKVLRCYLQPAAPAWAVNPPRAGGRGPALLAGPRGSLPGPVHGVSIITPPEVTERVVEDAARPGIRRLWMQPGAESPLVIRAGPRARAGA